MANINMGDYGKDVKEYEQKAKDLIMALPEKQAFSAFDIAEKMGAKDRYNINVAESIIRRMHGTFRESDGRSWVFSPSNGVHGSWRKVPRTDGR